MARNSYTSPDTPTAKDKARIDTLRNDAIIYSHKRNPFETGLKAKICSRPLTKVRSSSFKAGIAETIIEESVSMLNELKTR